MKKTVTILLSCLCVCSILLTGCGNKAKNSDELSQQVYQIIESYAGDASDNEYHYVKALVVAENTRQICLEELASCEKRIASTNSMINFFEKFEDQEEISRLESEKKLAEEARKEMVDLLIEAIELEEDLLNERERSRPII